MAIRLSGSGESRTLIRQNNGVWVNTKLKRDDSALETVCPLDEIAFNQSLMRFRLLDQSEANRGATANVHFLDSDLAGLTDL